MRRLWREVVSGLALSLLLMGCVGSGAKPTAAPEDARNKVASPSSNSSASSVAKGTDVRRPRKHHYLFAHRLLPRIFFTDTDQLMMRLKADPEQAIVRFWNSVGESVSPDERLLPEGLSAEYGVRPDGVRVVLVTLPPAEVSPEAIFAALAIRGRERWYLAYERSKDPAAPDREIALLCGWNSKGEHQNYGMAGDYSRSAFNELLDAFLAKLPAPVAGIDRDGKVWQK